MSFHLEEHVGVLIKKAARLFEQVANRDLEDVGVTYAQTTFLIRLWDQDGQSQAELAKSAGLRQPTVVRTLDRMEADQLIKRVRNKDDRRVFNFFLTAKGKKACTKLEGHANTMNAIASKSVTKKDLATLISVITRITGNLQQFLDEN